MRVLICCLAIVMMSIPLFAAENTVDVAGKWQASWQGRLGSQPITLDLKQHGAKLTGKLIRSSGTAPLLGSVAGKDISFTVNFPGPKSFTILFKGSLEGDSIKGTSQAQNVGTSGAYLGHGGEIVQPDHPWTATREHMAEQTARVTR